jgi:hypothetical protein
MNSSPNSLDIYIRMRISGFSGEENLQVLRRRSSWFTEGLHFRNVTSESDLLRVGVSLGCFMLCYIGHARNVWHILSYILQFKLLLSSKQIL